MLLLLLSSLVFQCKAAVPTDEIKHLPGWNQEMSAKIYSGFMTSTPQGEATEQHMHYMFFEAEKNPSTAPVLIWSNGGPGAGSEFGLFTELGPYYLSEESLKTADYNKTGIPSLFRNEHSWTNVANILMYDAPPPVGFSYCGSDVGGDGYSCGNWDDDRAAKAAHTFVENFFKAFPEYAKNDLYLSGESYAGVYIPMLAEKILDSPSATKDRLKGFAVGDACAGTDVICGGAFGPWFNVQFFHGHGQFSDSLYEELIDVCGVAQLKYGVTDQKCKALLDKMDDEIGGYYSYSLYDECGAENILSSSWQGPDTDYYSHVPAAHLRQSQQALQGALNDYPCGGVGSMIKWLNNTKVKDALHIPDAAYFFLTDNGVGFNYTVSERTLMPFYNRVVANTDIRVLVYNGDTDPSINSFASQNWTRALGFGKKEEWRPWTLDGKQHIGGYVIRYQNDFDFLTIRGSGHMVPEYKPAAALEFITKWLSNEEYLSYVKP